ncbi:MAG: hypothetical protein ACOYOI_09530 [Chthoniobacterales bacterium]
MAKTAPIETKLTVAGSSVNQLALADGYARRWGDRQCYLLLAHTPPTRTQEHRGPNGSVPTGQAVVK